MGIYIRRIAFVQDNNSQKAPPHNSSLFILIKMLKVCFPFALFHVAVLAVIQVIEHILHFLSLTLRHFEPDWSTIASFSTADVKTVLVTDGGTPEALHVVRSLKDLGHRVVVASSSSLSPSRFSLSCDKFVYLPSKDTLNVEELIRQVREVLIANGIDVVIPVGSYADAQIFGLAKDRLQNDSFLGHIQWICPSLDTTTKFIEKDSFASLLDGYEISNMIDQDLNGVMYSSGYIVVDGKVTFASTKKLTSDSAENEFVPMHSALDIALVKLMKNMCLSGLFTFEYIVDENGDPNVVCCKPGECRFLPIASSKSLWAEAFFGIDIRHRQIVQDVAAAGHRGAFSFFNLQLGKSDFLDPLPFIATQIQNCKNYFTIEQPTESALDTLKAVEWQRKLAQICHAVRYVDMVIMDVNVKDGDKVATICREENVKLALFRFNEEDGSSDKQHSWNNEHAAGKVVNVRNESELDALISSNHLAETRVIVSAATSLRLGRSNDVQYLLPSPDAKLSQSQIIPLRPLNILHIAGSAASEYYEQLSVNYVTDAVSHLNKNVPIRFQHFIAYLHRSNSWSVGRIHPSITSQPDALKALNKLRLLPGKSLSEILCDIQALDIDAVQPHIYDFEGLTNIRTTFDAAGLPVIGCSGMALHTSTNKSQTKAIASTFNVPTPPSILLRNGATKVPFPRPFVVKPVQEDNSMGLSLVQEDTSDEELEKILHEAGQFGDVLVEKYIPLGRELRISMLENANGSLTMLPILEYHLSQKSPMRLAKEKYSTDSRGIPTGYGSSRAEIPAKVSDALRRRLFELGKNAHVGLDCRDYSLFDIRVDEDENAFLLESCLYCSFASGSIIVKMMRGAEWKEGFGFGRVAEKVAARRGRGRIWRKRAIGKRLVAGKEQLMGMKRKN